MPRELKEVVATHVSIVKKAANGYSFLVAKSADGKDLFEIPVTTFIVEKSSPERKVTGIVYKPNEVDLQGDFMSAEAIEKMADSFMEKYQNIDKSHDYESKVGAVLASYCAPVDFELEGTPIAKGTWLLTTRVDDETFEAIEKGEFNGYSIGGYCTDFENIDKSVSLKDKLFDTVKSLFPMTVIEKDFNEELENHFNTDFLAVFRMFEDAVYKDYWKTDKLVDMKDKILASLDQMRNHISQMTFEQVNKEDKGETAMNEEEVKVLIQKEVATKDEAITKLSEQVTELTSTITKMFAGQVEINKAVEKALVERKSAIGSTVVVEKQDTDNPAMGLLGR